MSTNGSSPPAFLPKWEFVTPDRARELLGQNTHNRRLSKPKIREFARDMEAGRWNENTPDVVCVSSEGWLENGQHRLTAIIETGVSIWMLVAHDVPATAQNVIDSGKIRSFSDNLYLRGESNVSTVASACRWCWLYEKGFVPGAGASYAPTKSELAEWLEANPGIRESTRYSRSLRTKFRLPESASAGIHYEISKIDPEEADGFFNALAADGHQPGSVILALQKWFIGRMAQTGKVDIVYISAITIKAFNYWIAGKEVKQLTWRRGGTSAESFPRIEFPDV